MSKIELYKQDGSKAGATIEVSDAVFGADVKEHLLYDAVRYQMNMRRQGTHDVKNRAEISGGGRKPFKQKGTGRARAGTTRSAQSRGGGVVFGPTPRDHGHKMNKKVRRQALCSALSQRAKNNDLIVLESLDFDAPKTKQFAQMMAAFELADALVVVGDKNDNVELSAKNISTVSVVRPEGVNVYDILLRSKLVMTKDAVEAVTNRLGGA